MAKMISKMNKLLKSPTNGPIIAAKTDKGRSAERLANLYTGARLNPKWVGGVGGTYVAGKTALSAAEEGLTGQMKRSTMNKVAPGPAAFTSYDGVGKEAKSASNLNATGDIVFGLHNQRKG